MVCGDLRGRGGRSEENDRVAVSSDFRIVRHEAKRLRKGLSHQKPIKWIAVNHWKVLNCNGVLSRDLEENIAALAKVGDRFRA